MPDNGTTSTKTQYGAQLPDGTYDWENFLGTPATRKDYLDRYNERLASFGLPPVVLEFVKRDQTISYTDPVPVAPDETSETSTISTEPA